MVNRKLFIFSIFALVSCRAFGSELSSGQKSCQAELEKIVSTGEALDYCSQDIPKDFVSCVRETAPFARNRYSGIKQCLTKPSDFTPHPEIATYRKIMSSKNFGFLGFFKKPTRESPIGLFKNKFFRRIPLNLKACRDSNDLSSPKIDKRFRNSCWPDTLYSWQSKSLVDQLLSVSRNKNWKNTQTQIFFARAPIATFGYGDFSIRMKLKSNVKFHVIEGAEITGACKNYPNERNNTVFVRAGTAYDAYADWMICSLSVAHSLSLGAKEHYDEIVSDYVQHKKDSRKADFYSADQVESSYPFSENLNIFKYDIDLHNFIEERFIDNLEKFLTLIENKRGWIVFNPDLPSSEKKAQKHFATPHPIYFHR